MKIYRKIRQTKFVKPGSAGLLTLHDNGTVAVSLEHKELFRGLDYLILDSYYEIRQHFNK